MKLCVTMLHHNIFCWGLTCSVQVEPPHQLAIKDELIFAAVSFEIVSVMDVLSPLSESLLEQRRWWTACLSHIGILDETMLYVCRRLAAQILLRNPQPQHSKLTKRLSCEESS